MLKNSQFLLPPDVFFRHLLVAQRIGTGSVLDVGGSLRELSKFRKMADVLTVDVIGGDVIYRGFDLPFLDGAFDNVVSVDTLEHIPPVERLGFVKEMLRVARGTVCVVAPYASKGHQEMEANMAKKYEKENKKMPDYLREHIDYGLVNDQLLKMVEELGAEIRLFGSVKTDKVNFAIHTFELKSSFLNRILYQVKFVWNWASNRLVPVSFWLLKPKQDNASRVMILISK